jgi:hypothetical protein
VYKTKRNELGEVTTYKARFVAQGFSQEYGKDYWENYSPVAELDSIRDALCLAAIEDWDVENMDVNSAFLNSDISEEIYVQATTGLCAIWTLMGMR